MAVIVSHANERSGIPLGGLGTGSVELRPNGEFHEWQIANNGEWKEDCRGIPCDVDKLLGGGGLTFFVRTQQDKDVKVRKLALSIYQNELRSSMFSWLKPMKEIVFEGKSPIAELNYADDTLPVTVSAVAMSPLVPHDENKSATPGFYMTYNVKNNSDKAVRVSLLGKLQNQVCDGARNRKLQNTVIQDGEITRIFLASKNTDELCANNGSMCFSASGGEISWISGDYRDYMDSYISSTHNFGVSEESVLFGFRANGELPDTEPKTSLGNKIWQADSELKHLSDEQLDELIKEYKAYAFAQSLEERIIEVDADFLSTKEGKLSYIALLRHSANLFEGEEHADKAWGDCALSSSFKLEPNEEKEVRFIVSWFFPNHYSKNGYRLGHMYENLFADALEVNRYLSKNFTSISNEINGFIDCLLNTTLDAVVCDSWLIHMATLIKSSWWIKDGRFGIWEGIGSCGFHTTDITYQGSFSLLALFPEIQKRQMLMGADFQNDKGRVHHFFTPDFSSVDDGFGRVDMNSQFVLLVCRDFLWTGDKEYLNKLFPNIVEAIESLTLLDTDNDGLLDVETKHNTYDAWNFFGTPSYIEGLWLSCLLAGEFLAKAVNREDLAQQYHDIRIAGKKSMEKTLWNGSYYSLWRYADKRDECCMTDQLSGEWYTRLMGLGGVLDDAHIMTAIESILQYNYSGENGLINASYPENTQPTIFTHRNCQAEANWSGIEFSFSSLLYLTGLEKEATQIVRTVDERYKRSGRIWNHMECGDHYYRAMSSWSTLLAMTGFTVNKTERAISICPNVAGECVKAPWVTTEAFGSFSKEDKKLKITCLSGNLSFQKIVCNLKLVQAEINFNNKKLDFAMNKSDNNIEVVLSEALIMHPGEEFIIIGKES